MLAALATPANEPDSTPLLRYAMEQQFEALPDTTESRAALVAAEHALRQIETPRQGCARTLGAARFAGLWNALGEARANRADHAGAADAFRRAAECLPRSVSILSALATELKWMGDLPQARQLLVRALTIDPRNATVRQQLGQIDFLEQRWADAIANYRYAATHDDERHDAAYSEIMFHLAQRRAGVAKPEVLHRPKKLRTDDDGEDDEEELEWPTPILETLRGVRSEQSLLEQAQDDSGYPSAQERLCEALYYIGQERLARGETDVARRYLAAVVNTRVLYFIEHNLALSELRRIGVAQANTRPADSR